MKNKFSPNVQNEFEDIFNKIQIWKDLFDIQLEFYHDGWAISLKERRIYPRSIVIFKCYRKNLYSIKSFEVHPQNYKKEKFNELYFIEDIKSKKELFRELRDIIYGKDLRNHILNMCEDTFSR
ncbi:MAG: hypothetical protein ACFFCI_23625 [Promethearchaeota archaeon]